MKEGGRSHGKTESLVLYGSITGNTALVAGEFQKVCEENGFDTDW